MAKQVYDDQKFTGVRLPTNVKPVHYDLTLKPNLEGFTFQGHINIEYLSDERVSSIVLHAYELDISEGSINDENPLIIVTYSKASETATLEFRDPIALGGSLYLKFSGTLNDKLKGFYRTSCKVDDHLIYGATTKFEPTFARRAIPCWDEPSIKATFTVKLVISKWLSINSRQFEIVALSNTSENSRTGPDDELVVAFDKTPIMSTYLLAFIVGPFELIETFESGKPVRVYTTPGKKEQGRFALDVACKSLQFYEDLFGIKYPLPKLDLIAIPDFASGAMENWGLITFREVCLLVDNENTSTNVKRFVAICVAHELAHQWFGNLVTMEWWTHLWLNEGFATFMEYLCVDQFFPEYDLWSQFLMDSYCPAMILDALSSSHPIEVPINHPSEIPEIYDEISYHKGASVIRMLYSYIGNESFRKGLKDYLTKFAYQNATTEDLWDSLEAASKKPVRRLMTGWTRQKGYPWLSVEYSENGDDAKLTISQCKFTANGALSGDEAETTWMIPISLTTSKNPKEAREVCLLEDKSGHISLKNVKECWIKLNPGTIGLYRCAYPTEMIDQLSPAILDKTLPPMDRFGIQNDLFALCQAGKVSSVDVLQLLLAFKSETVHTVWGSIDSCLSCFAILLTNTKYKAKFYAYGLDLYKKIYDRLGWSPKAEDSPNDGLTRELVLNRMVSFGVKCIVREAISRFRAHVDKTKLIDADLRSVCYRAAASYGDESDFDKLIEIYRTSELHEEKNRAGRALGFTIDSERLKKVIKFAFSDEVRNQDKASIIAPIGVTNPPVAFDLLREHKDKLREIYESGPLMSRVIKRTTENFASEERAAEVSKFFEENKFPGAERSIQQSLETIRLNASWLERDCDKINAYLAPLWSVHCDQIIDKCDE